MQWGGELPDIPRFLNSCVRTNHTASRISRHLVAKFRSPHGRLHWMAPMAIAARATAGKMQEEKQEKRV
jgi:hypothetical protein